MDFSPPGSSIHGILLARILEWAAISCSKGFSPPRDQTHVSCIGWWVLYHWTTWRAHALDMYQKVGFGSQGIYVLPKNTENQHKVHKSSGFRYWSVLWRSCDQAIGCSMPGTAVELRPGRMGRQWLSPLGLERGLWVSWSGKSWAHLTATAQRWKDMQRLWLLGWVRTHTHGWTWHKGGVKSACHWTHLAYSLDKDQGSVYVLEW